MWQYEVKKHKNRKESSGELRKYVHWYPGSDGVYGVDPLRITLMADGLGMSGFVLDDLLQQDHGVCAEMSTDKVNKGFPFLKQLLQSCYWF